MGTEAINLAVIQVISLYLIWESCSLDGTQEEGGVSHMFSVRHSYPYGRYFTALLPRQLLRWACLGKSILAFFLLNINLDKHGEMCGKTWERFDLKFQELSSPPEKTRVLKLYAKNDLIEAPWHQSNHLILGILESALFSRDLLLKIKLHKFRIEVYTRNTWNTELIISNCCDTIIIFYWCDFLGVWLFLRSG